MSSNAYTFKNSSADYEIYNLSAEFQFCFVRVTFSSDSCSVIDYDFGGLDFENATSLAACTVKGVDAPAGEEVNATEGTDEGQTKRIQCHCNDSDLCATEQKTFENFLREQIALIPNQTTVYHCLLEFFENSSYIPRSNASKVPIPTPLLRYVLYMNSFPLHRSEDMVRALQNWFKKRGARKKKPSLCAMQYSNQ
ncbi:hypothetical protein ANCCAN_02953 [Ancylostoma caninum]|uniref:Uncharacterized protein n=1 Tax=Ancylostoma caninum TaxID=29170 RepID=A0A368H6L2_ANCCA|nr:hypothetical protein ANCCAN_02953 [Ancylostoma caninum]